MKFTIAPLALAAAAVLSSASAARAVGPFTYPHQTRQIEAYAFGAGVQDVHEASAADFAPWSEARDAAVIVAPAWDLRASAAQSSTLDPSFVSITGLVTADRRAAVIPDDVASAQSAMVISLTVTADTPYAFTASMGTASARSLQRMMRLSRIGGSTVFAFDAVSAGPSAAASGFLAAGDYRFEVIYGAAADFVAPFDSTGFSAVLSVPAPGTMLLALFAVLPVPRRRR